MPKETAQIGLVLLPVELSTAQFLALFVAGTSLSLLLPSISSATIGLSAVLALVLLGLIRLHRGPAQRRLLCATLCVTLGFALAIARFHAQLEQPMPSELESQTLTVHGHVTGLPDIASGRSRFRFRVAAVTALPSGVDKARVAKLFRGALLQLNCYRCPLTLQPHQTWQLSVRLKRPRGYASWGAFDYEKYLFRHKVFATGYVRIQDANMLRAEAASGVQHLRAALREQVTRLIPEHSPGRGMIAALMMGDRGQLSSGQRAVLQKTGVSHLMAISGLHVGLVFALTVWVAGRLLSPAAALFNVWPRQLLVLMPALLTATAYAALAGFAVSTQRALIMAGVFVVGRLIGRDCSLMNVLAVSAAIILLYDPWSVLDTGFWLSCGAVWVIALCQKYRRKISLLRLQPALWLGMLPLSVLFFGQVSLVSPLVNLIAVPLFCSVVIPLVLAALVLLLLPVTAIGNAVIQFLLSKIQILCDWVFLILELIAGHPQFQWYAPAPNFLDYTLASALLVSGLWAHRKFTYLRWLLAPLLLLAVMTGSQKLARGEADIVLLDVGQGLAMVIHTRNSTIVYDTGPAYASGFSAAQAVLIPYLRSRGVAKLEQVIVSHADNDHIGGLPMLQDAMPISALLSSRPDRVLGADTCRAGQRWEVDGVQLHILSPDSNTPAGSNNLSCVVMITVADTRVLITGDIERPVERYLLETNTDLHADILLVPHQGSKTSSTARFLDVVQPQIALVAAGYLNHYGHPHASVIARYRARSIPVLSTVDGGSIRLELRAFGWRVAPFRETQKRFWRT